MPTKKAVVVKSETAAAVSPAVDAVPAKSVRKRTANTSAKKAATTTEAPAQVSAEKKSRASSTRKKPAVEAAAVTHRHKKQESALQESTVTFAALVTPYEPSHDEVAKLAYSYYEARGYQPGDPRTDWFRAVQELKARHSAATSLLED